MHNSVWNDLLVQYYFYFLMIYLQIISRLLLLFYLLTLLFFLCSACTWCDFETETLIWTSLISSSLHNIASCSYTRNISLTHRVIPFSGIANCWLDLNILFCCKLYWNAIEKYKHAIIFDLRKSMIFFTCNILRLLTPLNWSSNFFFLCVVIGKLANLLLFIHQLSSHWQSFSLHLHY